MSKFHDILKEYWGYDSFRPLQHEIISSVCKGRDTLAILPTGGGKSLTYQVPALSFEEGITLVISPLIALMQDQVENLAKRHIRAQVLHSGLSHNKIYDILEQCELGAYRLLYVSPERLSSPLFVKRLAFLNINLVAVDEAHCISEWGYDFRPSYLKIAQLRELLPEDVPFLALTASATPKVVDDIREKLQLKEPAFFSSGIERSNLYYVVRKTVSRESEMIHILQNVPGTAIVYARTRKNTEDLAKMLCDAGLNVDFYHAGLDSDVRAKKQAAWTAGEIPILVATNAFGMGIDKADVRIVIHYDAPDALEQYYQEAGRAGRDGEKAFAVLLVTDRTLEMLKERPVTHFPPKEYIKSVYQHLADYYEVGADMGEFSVHPFHLEKFCYARHLSFAQAEAALTLLQWAGYITITDEAENPSKLRITIPAAELYEWGLDHPKYEPIMELMLRSYSGIMTDSVHISEKQMAKTLGCSRQDIYNSLRYLHDMDAVVYVPFSKSKLLIYNTPRLRAEELVLPYDVYEGRIAHYQERVDSMFEYAAKQSECRSRLLSRYFGIPTDSDCGHCDVCLRKNRTTN